MDSPQVLWELDRNTSYTGKEIKKIVSNSLKTSSVVEFQNHYINKNTAVHPLKDNIYYFITFHFVDNNDGSTKERISILRDTIKSPRKEKFQSNHNTNKSQLKPKCNDNINNNTKEDIIYNYYKNRYSNSQLSSGQMKMKLTDDDIICLNCGTILDDQLTDVPYLNYHLNNYICPCCNSKTSDLALYNSYTKSISIYTRHLIYPDNKK